MCHRVLVGGTALAKGAAVPSVPHEAPLVVLREDPELVASLLRDSLGLMLPDLAAVEVADAGFTQVQPAEFRADLVLHLRGATAGHPVVMGVVVEVQRRPDDRKRRTWPLYLSALHARLDCPTCLVVLAADERVARWAATPITSLQPGSSLVPLVLGPREVPRPTRAEARSRPWLAVLAALVHGNDNDGVDAVVTALTAVTGLAEEHKTLCYDLVLASLGQAARHALEDAMRIEEYEFKSDWGKMYAEMRRRGLAEGRAEGRAEGQAEGRAEGERDIVLALAERHGPIDTGLRARVRACSDLERLRELALALAAAGDAATVAGVLAALPEPPAPPAP